MHRPISETNIPTYPFQSCPHVCCVFASVDLFTVRRCPLKCQLSQHFQGRQAISTHGSTKSEKYAAKILQTWVNKSHFNHQLTLFSSKCYMSNFLCMFPSSHIKKNWPNWKSHRWNRRWSFFKTSHAWRTNSCRKQTDETPHAAHQTNNIQCQLQQS